MVYWQLYQMRPGVRKAIREGIGQSGGQATVVLNDVSAKLSTVDLQVAERFRRWANSHGLCLEPKTIETRWHEYRKKLLPCPDKEAAAIWEAHDPETPADKLLEIALQADDDFSAYVAGNPSAPLRALKLLAVHEHYEVRRRVAAHRNVPPWILGRLATDPVDQVREQVVRNFNSCAETLADLAGDREWFIRMEVAKHPDCPPDTLARLAWDRSSSVRESVARHAKTPTYALDHLAADPEPSIRVLAAKHKSTAHQMLVRLRQDPDPGVRKAVEENPGPPSPRPTTASELSSAYRAAKKALTAWLEENFASGEKIHRRRVKGTIIAARIDDEDRASLLVEDPSGSIITISVLELDSDPP